MYSGVSELPRQQGDPVHPWGELAPPAPLGAVGRAIEAEPKVRPGGPRHVTSTTVASNAPGQPSGRPLSPESERAEVGARRASRASGDVGRSPESRASVPLGKNTELVDAWAKFLGRWSWDWFATMTFPKPVHPEAADKCFRLWISKINRTIGGQVRWVRALELQRREVIHYHALLGSGGVSELRRLSWMDKWSHIAGWARIEPPRSDVEVRGYCAKYTAKGGEVDCGGPGMHEPPVTRWPREWLPWSVLRKRDRVRDVVSDDEWKQLQRWTRSLRRPLSGSGWCKPGFPDPPAFVAEILERLLTRARTKPERLAVQGQGELGLGPQALCEAL